MSHLKKMVISYWVWLLLLQETFALELHYVPSLKAAAPLAVRLFSSERGHFSYGQSGGSTLEIRKEMVKLNQHLMKDKLDYAWINSASEEYSQAITRLLFMSSIHASVLDVHSLRKEMEPSGEVEFWCNAVLEAEDNGLIQALETINQIVQGLNTFQATSILEVFKENAMPTSSSTVCQQVHTFRDYLMDIQIQGYALVSTCLNYNGSLAIEPLLEMGLKRLKQQEEILGGRFNDWYAYGKASCSYQIQQFERQDHCIKVSDTVELFNDYSLVELKECDRNRPTEDTQWIYNKVSWQIVPRNNQSLCLQKLFNGYNVGIPIVLKQCQQYQYYNERWTYDTSTMQIKLLAAPNKCIKARKDGSLVLGKCSKSECLDCPDKWGNARAPLHQNVKDALKPIYEKLDLVTWIKV